MVGADSSLMPHIFTFLTRWTGGSDQPQVLQKTGEPRAGKHERIGPHIVFQPHPL